ncbi:uncharacterized protein [Dermacentor andersoni]|uniref:uncharacterized protein n=1 Tax=Dermacentor andersoni TaxID=34620 RepID=UPI0024172CEA|nr:uncharacterized protein LOC129380866 [Dermacentor andersoni]
MANYTPTPLWKMRLLLIHKRRCNSSALQTAILDVDPLKHKEFTGHELQADILPDDSFEMMDSEDIETMDIGPPDSGQKSALAHKLEVMSIPVLLSLLALMTVASAGLLGGGGGGGDDDIGLASISYVKTPVVSVKYVAKPVVSYVAKPVTTVSHSLKPVVTYTISGGHGGFGGGGYGGGGHSGWPWW